MPINRVVGGTLRCLRPRAMIFNATAIASFTRRHFGVWFTKHKSS
jgi:hypothetical protein